MLNENEKFLNDETQSMFEELNVDITEQEILNAIKQLKSNGPDKLINGVFLKMVLAFRFDPEKLNDPTVMSAFQATIGGRFAPLATLVDEDADLDSMVTCFNKAVTDTAAELLGKQRRKRKPWVTPEILDLCDQRQDLKKKRGESEGAKDYREITRKIRTEMKTAKETWIQDQCQEVEA